MAASKPRKKNSGPRSKKKGGGDTRGKRKDESFAFPKQRKEPINDAKHVRNAIARFDQVEDVTDAERDAAWRRIRRAAKRFGVDVSAKSWRALGKKTSKR